jgi:hypothetical protein
MKSKKQLGIWMDHSVAHCSELINNTIITESIESNPVSQVNKEDLYYKDESHMLNKEQDKLSVYYSKLSNVVLNYDEVVLFGPTDAKNELLNLIKNDHLFAKISVEAKAADKMSKIQQLEFIKDYFNPNS